MLAIWSLVPLLFLKPAWTSGSSRFTYQDGTKDVVTHSTAGRISFVSVLFFLPLWGLRGVRQGLWGRWSGPDGCCTCRRFVSQLRNLKLREPESLITGYKQTRPNIASEGDSIFIIVIVVVQLLSRVWLFATPWTATLQASLSITNSQSFLKHMSIALVMPSNHLTLCRPILLPSIFPSIRVYSNEAILHINWSKYWSFNFSISPSYEYLGLISLMARD